MPSRKTGPIAPARRVRQAAAPSPSTTVDVVVFTLMNDALHVLLARRPDASGEPFPGQWGLPGDAIDVAADEDLLACARRTLKEQAGVSSAYLEQLGSWGSAARDPRGWSATHVYFALVAARDARRVDGGPKTDVSWFAVPGEPRPMRLAFDHDRILEAALERLRSKVEYTSLPAFLLPEPFTLPQLQRAYEAVLGRPLDKSSFRTRMLDAGFLKESDFIEGQSNRPAMGYRVADRRTPVVFPRTFKWREGE